MVKRFFMAAVILSAVTLCSCGGKEEQDPTVISTRYQLQELASAVAAGDDMSGVTIVLTADIDLQGSSSNMWVPIGSLDTKFNGVFAGAGYSISGLYISGENKYQGLFGFIGSDGAVTNLSLKGTLRTRFGTSKETCYNGGIVGRNQGVISYCRNEVDVYHATSATSMIMLCGGVAGYNEGQIVGCYNVGSVTGTTVSTVTGYSGGIVGRNSVNATVVNCYNVGSVYGSNENAGGIAGQNFNDHLAMSDCFYKSGAVTGAGDNGDRSVAMSDAEMKYVSFVTTLNGDLTNSAAIWKFDSPTTGTLNSGYPLLFWE